MSDKEHGASQPCPLALPRLLGCNTMMLASKLTWQSNILRQFGAVGTPAASPIRSDVDFDEGEGGAVVVSGADSHWKILLLVQSMGQWSRRVPNR